MYSPLTRLWGVLVALLPFAAEAWVGLDSLRVETQEGKLYVIHQVDQGETLYSISQRYQTPVKRIVDANSLADYGIDLDDLLRIPYRDAGLTEPEVESPADTLLVVKAGETVYHLSSVYQINPDSLRAWNEMDSDSVLKAGQKLRMKRPSPQIKAEDKDSEQDENRQVPGTLGVDTSDPPSPPSVEEETESNDEKAEQIRVPLGKEEQDKVPPPVVAMPGRVYHVQTGETLESISEKFGVPEDSIRVWNEMRSKRLSIGQQLVFPFVVDAQLASRTKDYSDYKKTPYGSRMKRTKEGGITRVVEEGIAGTIETISPSSTKYLALHRTLEIGAILRVRNLMNNQTMNLRVVGKLPDTSINGRILLRMNPICYTILGIEDETSLVEIVYFEK